MREYLVDKGKLRGTYIIYDSVEDFRKHLPDTPLYRWGEKDPREMKIGDWVRAYDDFICQILTIHVLGKDPNISFFVRFPMATIPAKYYKGKLRFYEFYAMFTLPVKGQFTAVPSGMKDIQGKVKFAALILAGVNPVMAYKNAFNNQTKTLHQILYKIRALLDDKMIGDLVMSKFTEIQEKVNAKITDDDFVEKIVKHWEATLPGDKNFLQTATFIGKVSGKFQGNSMIDKGNKDEVEDADFTEEPPKEISNS